MTSRHLGSEPISDSDEEIAAALSTVSITALTASIALLTGDPSCLRGPIRPKMFMPNEFQGTLEDDEQDQLRRDALKAIVAWRDAGCPPVRAPSDELVGEALDWIACEPLPEEYRALYLEEMDLHGLNPRAIALPPDTDVDQGLSVLVIGCGEAGLLAGIRLKEAGIAFEILDKNDDVGGTWLENTYPGCRVDVASHYYCYSFESNDYFSSYYTRQPEVLAYLRQLMADHDIARHVRWRREVVRAVWDEQAALWAVTVRTPDGAEEVRTARVLISGVGILNRPSIPDLPNLDRFEGPVFHSARWDHSVDYRGKRVALIGAGASGFQIGPAIVDDVESLVVFQRTAQWMAPNPRYHAEVTAGERWAMRHLPPYSRIYRFMLMWGSNDRMLELVRTDETWADFPRTANATSGAFRDFFAGWITQQVGDDPELAAKVMPTYPPMGKRMLQDNGSWLQCLKRPHVKLVKDQILDIDAHSILTSNGRYEVDVIVLATGFKANDILFPMEIIGRDGISIQQFWDGKPAAYQGVSLPGFPNFFIMTGPGTGLAHGGSVITMTECQMRYIGEALSTMLTHGYRTIEPTVQAHARDRDELQQEMATLIWGHPSIEHSWYKAADGNVYILCPYRLVDYWQKTAHIEASEHQFS